MKELHPEERFPEGYGKKLSNSGLQFIRDYFYNSEGVFEYQIQKHFLWVEMQILGKKAKISFGRKWRYRASEKLSNDYQAFLDYFDIEGRSEFDLSCVSLEESFEEINKHLRATLPQVLSLLSEDNISEIEALPTGIEFTYRKQLMEKPGIRAPKMISL